MSIGELEIIASDFFAIDGNFYFGTPKNGGSAMDFNDVGLLTTFDDTPY